MSRDNNTYKEVYNRSLDFVRFIGVEAELPTEIALSEEWASSRTTIRAVLAELKEKKIIDWSGRKKTVLRQPTNADYFAHEENGHRYYHPIYEAAVAHDLPVAIHPGTEGRGVSGKPSAAGYPGSYFEWHTNLAGSYMAHLLSLVSEGTFQKFPTLKFVLIEGGVSWLVPTLWRFDKNWKSLRMTVPWLDRPPSEIIFDHIFLTTQPIEEPNNLTHLHQILDMFPADQILMFATDFPHWDGDTPDFSMRMLPKSLRSSVMWETASKLYKLPVVEFD